MPGRYAAAAATAPATNPVRFQTWITIDSTTLPDFDLPVETGKVKFSEDWSPAIQADFTTPLPTQAQLAALDPRLPVRVIVKAGYVYWYGTPDVQLLADLHLRTRYADRPANVLALSAASDEALAQDRIRNEIGEARDFAGLNEAVDWFASYGVYPATPVYSTDFAAGYRAWAVTGLEAPVGSSMWSNIEDAAARAGAWVYCLDDRRWRISGRPAAAGTVQHYLVTGENGTIETSKSGIDRELYFNQAILEYVWTDDAAVEHRIVGRASVTSGPYQVAGGYKTYYQKYERPASQAQADAAAGTKLQNLVTRGRVLSLEAISALWLRQGQTISVTLRGGTAELHIIKSVEFDLATGRMQLDTRQPLDLTITTGE